VTVGKSPWIIRLAAAAESDYQGIIRWTKEQFGEAQARDYAETLSKAIEALPDWPNVPGVRRRDDILKGLFALHVTRSGRKGRHIVMFRVASDKDRPVIEVLRILHDSMDLPRHLAPPDSE
jgi:toxin ParE1/3/4